MSNKDLTKIEHWAHARSCGLAQLMWSIASVPCIIVSQRQSRNTKNAKMEGYWVIPRYQLISVILSYILWVTQLDFKLFFLLLVHYLYNPPVYQPGTILLFTTCATSLHTNWVLCSWLQPVWHSCIPLRYHTSVCNFATYLTFNNPFSSFYLTCHICNISHR